MLNMLRLVTNTAACVQPRRLRSRKQNSSFVLFLTRHKNPPFLRDSV